MWFPEPRLRNLIVRDPAHMIKVATKIICQHDMHFLPEHAESRKRHPTAYQKMVSEGIVSLDLIKSLWVSFDEGTHDGLLSLMIRFGLMLPLPSVSKNKAKKVRSLWTV